MIPKPNETQEKPGLSPTLETPVTNRTASASEPPHRPAVLAEMNLSQVRSERWEVAVLPFGATEPHNLHLPYGTDTLEADSIGRTVCTQANQQGARVLLLPTIPYGTETNLRSFPFALNLNPSTLQKIIEDLVESLVQSGIRKVLIFNSHGGNDFKPVLRELYGKTEAHLFLCNWMQMVSDVAKQICENRDDHAGEVETSLILAFRPDLVARSSDGRLLADEGSVADSRFEAVNQGWVGLSRPWHLLTTNSGSGNPHQASAEKGSKLLEAICDRLVPFLVDLSQSPLDASFPFAPREG